MVAERSEIVQTETHHVVNLLFAFARASTRKYPRCPSNQLYKYYKLILIMSYRRTSQDLHCWSQKGPAAVMPIAALFTFQVLVTSICRGLARHSCC